MSQAPPDSADAPPWLSIVMPTHQGERWLGATLDSLAAQSVRGFECLVIDSSPDDATLDLARSYDDRLTMRFFKRPDLNHWRSKTNFGFQEARAAHVCMLHQDDFWLPGRGEAVRRWIAAAPDIAVHLHPAQFVDASGRRLGLWTCPLPAGGAPISRDLLLRRLLVQNFISVPTPTIRRDAFLAVGGIDEALWYTGDWDLYLKLAALGAFAYHREVLCSFRIHGDSLTMTGSRDPRDFEAQMQSVLAAHIGQVAPAERAGVLKQARASIRINSTLAASGGNRIGPGLSALGAILGLGPRRAFEYLRHSRLAERVFPRLRAGLARDR
jgi:glycosyltransferase involved in cell wall biosynthesis